MTKLVVIIGFCVAFAAGLTVGLSRQRQPVEAEPASSVNEPTTRHGHRGSSFLATELNLTPQQQEQLKEIWSRTARGGRGDHEKRRQELRDRRDAEIEAIIRPEDKEKYQKAMSDYRAGLDAMDREMRDRFRNSVEETKKVLTPEQRAQYEEILSRQWGRDRDRDPNRETTRRSEPAGSKPTAH